MADRTSAEIFGRVFQLLANTPTADPKELARELIQISREYDFSPYQMYADEACMALDIARYGTHPHYPKDGVVLLFFGDPGFEEASSTSSGPES